MGQMKSSRKIKKWFGTTSNDEYTTNQIFCDSDKLAIEEKYMVLNVRKEQMLKLNWAKSSTEWTSKKSRKEMMTILAEMNELERKEQEISTRTRNIFLSLIKFQIF